VFLSDQDTVAAIIPKNNTTVTINTEKNLPIQNWFETTTMYSRNNYIVFYKWQLYFKCFYQLKSFSERAFSLAPVPHLALWTLGQMFKYCVFSHNLLQPS
jgi:hypothetical protein